MTLIKRITPLLPILFLTLSAESEIVFFNESPTSNLYYDPSWGYANSPSELELFNGDKFPVETDHVFAGNHSLRLHWTSKNGGDWGIAVASPGWTAWDLTQFDTLQMMINSTEAISGNNLPDLALEDINNQKSGRVSMQNWLSGLDDDIESWQKLAIPLSAFPPANCNFTQIKTVFFFQKVADQSEHFCYLDEIKAKTDASDENLHPPQNLIARGYDSRIDLRWKASPGETPAGYNIYKRMSQDDPFEKINSSLHPFTVFSDFLGENNLSCQYIVKAVSDGGLESAASEIVTATSAEMDDEALLNSIQEATFRYFYDYGHPVSGLARERSNGNPEICSIGGTGMGLISMIVGADRNFEPRDSVAVRILKILNFLENQTTRYHGAWAHWVNGSTGETIPFSAYDDGGDLVETSFLVQGMLTARSYFDGDNETEIAIRETVTRLWESVEWDWYLRYQGGLTLYWHWSPNYGWIMNIPVNGFNEAMITYLLAVASPTHAIPAAAYHYGWARNGHYPYVNHKTFYGYPMWVGYDYGGPLFFTQYSFLGFDPRDKRDAYCNYFDNNRNISLINRAYCIENPRQHTGYSELVWGLTASDDPWGYLAHEPNSDGDNGTITPTAAISAMPYIPDESIATLKYFYHELGPHIWKSFGFTDAFHLGEQWYSDAYLAIDQGTIVPMIENYRSGLCWNLFMQNPEIAPMLEALGFQEDPSSVQKRDAPQSFQIIGFYPNPFNHMGKIKIWLPVNGTVSLTIFNALGQIIPQSAKIYQVPAGEAELSLFGSELSSGVYFVQISDKHQSLNQKIVLLK